MKDVIASGYEGNYHIPPLSEVGLFEYQDKKTRQTKYAAMALDPRLVTGDWQDPDSHSPPPPPRCTVNYPTLQDQYERQCEIVAKDERLQKLIGADKPKPLPETVIIKAKEKPGAQRI